MNIPASFWAQPIRNLKFANWRQPPRRETRYITIHYNGPRVAGAGNPNAERDQLRFDAIYHMRPDVLNADGIQYHAAVLSNGERVLLRDLSDRLSHCGNARGNDASIAIHVPIGDMQAPTPAQIASLRLLLDTLRAAYGIHPINVKPHWEWKATACCGIPLGVVVGAYRADVMRGVPFQLFKTRVNANVRRSASVSSPVQYAFPRETVFGVAGIEENGTPFNGNRTYVALSDGSGFIHISIVRSIP